MNPTQQSLLEQMQIHDLEIARRKELLGFGPRDVQLLSACSGFIAEEVEALVAVFYEKQTGIDEISLIIGDIGTLTRLRAAMTRYVIDLFAGYYDEDYVNNRLRIGLVHKRIGVAPKYYLSAMRILKSLLLDVLARRMGAHPDREDTVQALDKLLYFDNEFVFDTYIRSLLAEIESAKDKAIQHALSLEQKVAERTRELEEVSRRDPLTGLYNQRFFAESLRRELSRARRAGRPLSLLYVDVDDFKLVNDRRGHLAGDEVLRAVAGLLQATCRDYDLCCRYGGDEFCVLLPDADAATATEIAGRLIEEWSRQPGQPPLSVGVAQAGPDDWPEPAQLIGQADRAMYSAKAQGGGRCAQAASDS
ncbi:GGDEF domain-containing protein [Aquabacterium sp.]|uniref:GGDEF domain-containing protein n=1 Tax=Aquabacterium sp. TaxID=1872578 RepID=UPI0037835BDE